MIHVFHVVAGARGSSRLVQDDDDRFALLARLVSALDERLLAYCIMDTHLHVLAEGQGSRRVSAALRAYARGFNARHRTEGPLLRGPVEAIRAPSEVELARTLRYLHDNPVRTHAPIVPRALEFEWSSARAFVGLSRAPFPNVARTRELLGNARGWGPAGIGLADLEPEPVPCAKPELILAAAAQTFGVDPRALAGTGRGPLLVAARAVYVHLGHLESYCDRQLAPALGRSRARTQQLSALPIDGAGVRIARTLLREPGLRARLQAPGLARAARQPPGRVVRCP